MKWKSKFFIAVIIPLIWSVPALSQELYPDVLNNLGIPKNILDLRDLQANQCKDARSVYPVIKLSFRLKFWEPVREVKIQECFLDDEKTQKIITVDLYNNIEKTKKPIGFVLATVDSTISQQRNKKTLVGQLGLANLGFIETGQINQKWHFINRDVKDPLKREIDYVREEIIRLLFIGFKKK